LHHLSRRSLGLLLAALLLAPIPALAQQARLSGRVVFRERMALPPGATLNVKLVDVSLADAPAQVIAETTISAGRGSPIAFVLNYDRAKVTQRRNYALQARIEHEGRLLFINTTRHPVLLNGRDRTTIRVERVRAEAAPQAASPAGRWLAEDILGGGVIDRLQSTIDIAADGRTTGSGGCNRISGKAVINGSNISFGAMASTRMACAPAVMNQEAKFLNALSRTRSFRVDARERKLYLLDAAGAVMVRLAAM
jgi:putative lipoprotein